MIQLKGIVNKITFQNEDTGFTVLRLEEETTARNHICVGVMPTVEQGESIAVCGEWITDKRFGLQFTVQSYERTRPTTSQGILLLLSSGLITDIGPVRAKGIVDTFGLATLDILDNQPQRLKEVPGIGEKRFRNIVEAWEKQKHLKELMLFLQEYGVTVNLIYKIYKAYGEKAKEAVSANPYKLIDDIWGVGFKKADFIAQKLGFEKDSYRRIKAGIIFTLQDAGNEGHVYLPKNELLDKTSGLLEIDREKVIFSLDHALQEVIVIADEDRIYLPLFFHAETAVAAMLCERIRSQQQQRERSDRREIDQWIGAYMEKHSWKPDPKQIQAIKTALTSSIMLLTGGPGTGKTTTIQVIVSFFRTSHLRVVLCAPTGRAAQRMGSIAGIAAQTIHRLLEYNPRKPGNPFKRTRHNPVVADVLICDEVSMIDILLMKNLLLALNPQTTVIFVGDNNQLPSIGAGNALADMIQSGKIPHIVLTTIFRQAAKSRIVTAAHEIMAGMVPAFSNENTENCFFIRKNDPQECLDTILELVTDRIPQKYSVDPVRDIQVLSPMHKGILGTQSINRILQARLNAAQESLIRGETSFYTGDKVMQIRNNYDNEVFNGDIGFVVKIIENKGLLVDFGEKKVLYNLRELEELVHAYCISIHKSQGCEFHTVIIPVMTQHYIMLQRNLIYTALTRAKKLCVIVGTSRALSIGISNNQAHHRYTRLAERICRQEK